jgi:hypothetical protein
MHRHCGKTAHITSITTREYDMLAYNIDIDDFGFSWHYDMFEDIRKIRKEKLKKLYDI